MISIKSKEDISIMRKGGAIIAQILNDIVPMIQAGTTTEDLDQYCHERMIKAGGIPSCLNYQGYPKATCISINEVVCHGIPSPEIVLKNNDIVNIDLTIFYKNFHVDMSRSFAVGPLEENYRKLLEFTEKCLHEAILKCKPRASFGVIGQRISELCAKTTYSIVEDYCGHGIGKKFHEDPQVLHYKSSLKQPLMQEGMTFTIEPMINMGVKETILMNDGWTVKTKDLKYSCQFEHTIAITQNSFEILTLP
jgi:methionyl aminopeptidase